MEVENKKIKKLPGIFSDFNIGKDKHYFIENLSQLLSAGMDISTALIVIQEELKSRKMARIFETVREEIDVGAPLWKTLEKTKILSANIISMIRIGEQTGRLSENLKIVAEHEQKQREFKSKIKSAMMYPVLVLVLTLVVGVGISWFVLPRLASVFKSLKMDLPLLSKIFVSIGLFLGEYGYIVVPVFLFLVFIFLFFLFIYSKTKFIGQEMFFRVPVIGKLVLEIEISRFGFILGNLLGAGLPLDHAITALRQATTFHSYRKFYDYLFINIEEGRSFKQSFQDYKKVKHLIPSPVQQLIISAEQSGNLSGTLANIGRMYEVKSDTTTRNLSVLIEPILLIIIWLGVVGVALSVILPIYSLVGELNNSTEPNTSPVSKAQTKPIDNPEKIFTLPEEIAPETIPAVDTILVPIAEEEIAQEVEIPIFPKLKVNSPVAGYLNVHQKPSLSGGIIKKVEHGDEFEYIDEQNGWYQIKLDVDVFGWVYGKYVELIK